MKSWARYKLALWKVTITSLPKKPKYTRRLKGYLFFIWLCNVPYIIYSNKLHPLSSTGPCCPIFIQCIESYQSNNSSKFRWGSLTPQEAALQSSYTVHVKGLSVQEGIGEHSKEVHSYLKEAGIIGLRISCESTWGHRSQAQHTLYAEESWTNPWHLQWKDLLEGQLSPVVD